MPLSASQEQQVRDLYYKRVRGYCADEIRGTHSTTTHPCPLPHHSLTHAQIISPPPYNPATYTHTCSYIHLHNILIISPFTFFDHLSLCPAPLLCSSQPDNLI